MTRFALAGLAMTLGVILLFVASFSGSGGRRPDTRALNSAIALREAPVPTSPAAETPTSPPVSTASPAITAGHPEAAEAPVDAASVSLAPPSQDLEGLREQVERANRVIALLEDEMTRTRQDLDMLREQKNQMEAQVAALVAAGQAPAPAAPDRAGGSGMAANNSQEPAQADQPLPAQPSLDQPSPEQVVARTQDSSGEPAGGPVASAGAGAPTAQVIAPLPAVQPPDVPPAEAARMAEAARASDADPPRPTPPAGLPARTRDADARQPGPPQTELRQAEPRQAEPRQAEPRQAEPRQADLRQADLRQAEPLQAEARQIETRHGEVRGSANTRSPDLHATRSPGSDQRAGETVGLSSEETLNRLRRQAGNAGSPPGRQEFASLPRPGEPHRVPTIERLADARAAVHEGRIEDARRFLQAAQVQLVFRPVTRSEYDPRTSQASGPVAQALLALGYGDRGRAIVAIEQAMGALAPSAPGQQFGAVGPE